MEKIFAKNHIGWQNDFLTTSDINAVGTRHLHVNAGKSRRDGKSKFFSDEQSATLTAMAISTKVT